MKAQLAETNYDPRSMDSSLRVVIAYDDFEAGQRAIRMMASLGKRLDETIDFEPLPWSFEILADPDWRDIATSDAVRADILIIASSSASPLPRAVGRWAEAAIGRKHGSPAAVVALFGPVENPDRTGSTRLEAIQTAALRAGLDFFAPQPRREPNQTIEGGHEMAPLDFNEILRLHQPAPRWGINE